MFRKCLSSHISLSPVGPRRRPVPSSGRAAAALLLAASLAGLLGGCALESEGGRPLTEVTGKGFVPQGVDRPTASGSYLAAIFAQSQFDSADAATYFLQALKEEPDNLDLLQRAYLTLAMEGRLAEALPLATKVLDYDSSNAFAALVVAVAESKGGQDMTPFDTRLKGLVGMRGTNHFLVDLVIAWAKAAQGHTDEALAALAPLAGNSAMAPLHDFHAGLMADLAGRNDVAEGYYRSAAASSQLSVRVVEVVGSFYQRQGRMDKARELYGRYLNAHPDTSTFDPADLLVMGKMIPRPVNDARQGMAEALFGLASSFRQSNILDAALLFNRLALALDPNFAMALATLGDVLQDEGHIDAANEVYRKVPTGSDMYWEVQLRLASNQEQAGHVEEAAEQLRTLAALRPKRIDALVELADLLARAKRYDEAIAVYNEVLARLGPDIQPRYWALYYARGVAEEEGKHWPAAEGDFLKAIDLAPEESTVLNYLGYSWVERGLNLDKAKAMIAKAVDLSPNDGYIVDSLGWVAYRLSDYRTAVKQLERAVELRAADPTINDHLGDALWRVGRVDEARFQWKRVLTLKPEDELAGQVKVKLEKGLPGPPPPPPPVPPLVVPKGFK